MHRVELKVVSCLTTAIGREMFLMHRVELKAEWSACGGGLLSDVPNAPCGVERLIWLACPYI